MGQTAAMATFYVINITIIGSTIAGHLHDISIIHVVSLDKQK